MAQSKGRAAPPLVHHTFPNGAVATIRQISQFTLASLEVACARQWPKPTPPLAPGVGGELEPNPADPEYQTALQRWQVEQALHVMDAMLDLAVDIDVDSGELARIMDLFARMGQPLEEISDKVAYLKHCCVLDMDRDLMPLARLIRGGIPQEEDVSAHVATFSGDVGANGHLSDVRAARESQDEFTV